MTKLEFVDKQIDRVTLASVFAMTMLLAFIGLAVVVFVFPPPKDADKNLTLILMAFSTGVGSIGGWLYGSSQNNAKRIDAMIKAMPAGGTGLETPLQPINNNTIINQPSDKPE